ncbi:MAG: hypothetical protein GY846_06455 [Deltaproteobacteria bacterium]|nr:hypothetical protein [Deltaproteobacteria bacterium]
MKTALVITYWMAFFFYASAFGSSLLRKKNAENSAALLGLIANVTGLVIIIVWSGQAPAFQLFESLMLAALILFGIGICCSRYEEKLPNVRTWIWLEILLLFGIAGFAQKAPSPYLYDHNDIFILLFHTLRIAVVSVTLFSSALYLQSRFDIREGNSLAIHRAHQGRNFLILGAMLFLTAEYIGILWCLRGWGDFWQWGAGFFQSTLIVVFFMLAVHVPGSNHRPGNWRPRLGILCGFLVLSLTAIRSMF